MQKRPYHERPMPALQCAARAVACVHAMLLRPRSKNFGMVNRMGARVRTCVSVRLRAREKWIVVT